MPSHRIFWADVRRTGGASALDYGIAAASIRVSASQPVTTHVDESDLHPTHRQEHIDLIADGRFSTEPLMGAQRVHLNRPFALRASRRRTHSRLHVSPVARLVEFVTNLIVVIHGPGMDDLDEPSSRVVRVRNCFASRGCRSEQAHLTWTTSWQVTTGDAANV
jgi:hypothetical protein